MLTLVRLFKLLWPLLKEYAGSNFRFKGNLSRFLANTLGFASVLLLVVYVFYGLEQAEQNLQLNAPLLKEISNLEKIHERLMEDHADLKRQKIKCDENISLVFQQCQGIRSPIQNE